VIRSRSRSRLAAVAAIGVLALGGLAACRTDAGTAAYVGNTRITDSQVESVVKLVPSNLPDASAVRVGVVNDFVFNAVAAKYAASKGISAPAVTDDVRAEAAQALQVSNDAKHRPLIDLEAQANQWKQALLSTAPNTPPTDADLMTAFNNVKAAIPGVTFEQLKPQILQLQGLSQAVALRNQMASAIKGYDISISPRYANNCVKAPCPGTYVPLLQAQGQAGTLDVVTLPLTQDNATPAVVDQPAPATQAPAPQQ
jgi:hypothetical protein